MKKDIDVQREARRLDVPADEKEVRKALKKEARRKYMRARKTRGWPHA